MKIYLRIFTLFTALLLLMSGCNKTTDQDAALPPENAESAPAEQAYSSESMVTVGGETVTLNGSNGFADPSLGFGMVYSDTLRRLVPDNFGLAFMGSSTVMAMYVPDAVIEIVTDPLINEAEMQEAYARYYQCFAIVRVTDEIGDEGTGLLPQLREIYAHEETAAELDGAEYVYFYNDSYDDAALSDSEREDVAALCAEKGG